MSTTIDLGNDYLLYFDSAHTHGSAWSSPTWVLATLAEEITKGDARVEINPQIRGSDFDVVLLGKRQLSLSLTCNQSADDPFIAALKAANVGKTSIHCALTDGPIATVGTKYIHADWAVLDYEESNDQGDAGKITCTLKPHANSANTPAAVTVAS